MASSRALQFYRTFYKGLIQLYPEAYRARFGESMKQTFADLCRARLDAGESVHGAAFWVFAETSASLAREHFAARTGMFYTAILALTYALIAAAFGLDGDLVAPLYLAAIGVILLSAGIVFVETRRAPFSTRAGAALALGTGFLMSWANPAIGMIGNESNQANLIFLGVFAVGVLGALAARFRARGLARTMLATAAAQLAVGIYALVAGLPLPQVPNGVFSLMWLLSGLLFLRGSRVGLRPR